MGERALGEEEGAAGERALGEPLGEEGVVGEGVGPLPLKQSKVDKGQIKCINVYKLCIIKSWYWKGKGFSVTLGMRLRNLRSSSSAAESIKGGVHINVYKLCINLLSAVGIL